jgi:hypothetical protein
MKACTCTLACNPASLSEDQYCRERKSASQAQPDEIASLTATIYQAIGTSHVHGAPLTALRKLTQMARAAQEGEA